MVRVSLPYQGIARRFFKNIDLLNDSEREKYIASMFMVRPSISYQGIARRNLKNIDLLNDSEREKYLSEINERDIDVSSANIIKEQESTVEKSK